MLNFNFINNILNKQCIITPIIIELNKHFTVQINDFDNPKEPIFLFNKNNIIKEEKNADIPVANAIPRCSIGPIKIKLNDTLITTPKLLIIKGVFVSCKE